MNLKKKMNKFPIKITHYINPHKFYFKLEYGFSEQNSELTKRLEEYALHKCGQYLTGYKPSIGEIILVFVQPWNKWVRANVDSIATFQNDAMKFILWALDDGVPVVSTMRWILPLSAEFSKIPTQCIYLGGLGDCIPIKTNFNYDKMEREKNLSLDWVQTAVTNVEKCFNTAAELWFLPDSKSDEHYFGQIEIHAYGGNHIDLLTHLVKLDYAKKTNDFAMDLKRINTLKKQRWQNNDGNLNAFTITTNISSFTDKNEISNRTSIDEIDNKIKEWHLKSGDDQRRAKKENIKRFQRITSTLIDHNTMESNDNESFICLAGTTYKQRDIGLMESNIRKPNYLTESKQSLDTYRSLTTNNNNDNFISGRYDEDMCSVTSATPSFISKRNVFQRVLNGLNRLELGTHDVVDHSEIAEPKKHEINVACIPSGCERDHLAFQKFNNSNVNK